MEYPRIKKFNFTIEKTYVIPSYYTGRLDLIAVKLFKDVRMYKPIASANNIKIPRGYRIGIRPESEAIKNELIMKGYSGDKYTTEFDQIMSTSETNNLQWINYDNVVYGYISDIYAGRVLLIPNYSSAQLYLQQYEYLEDN